MSGFWNSIKYRKLKHVPSTLSANDFAGFFKSTMQDVCDSDLTLVQAEIQRSVRDTYTSVSSMRYDVTVSGADVHEALRTDASAGWDSVTPITLDSLQR